jgi:hypothetical protein
MAGGCHSPNQANILLRKQNQQLDAKISNLQRRHDADQATIRGLQSSATTVPVLPEDELDELFTTSGLDFGRLTGGYHADPNEPGDTMLKIYVVPIDGTGDEIKAAGSFRVELFDLALGPTNRIGEWDFDLSAAKADWYGPLLYSYVLDCPWQTVPRHRNLLARVTFTDALTHRIFIVDRQVTVQPPGK